MFATAFRRMLGNTEASASVDSRGFAREQEFRSALDSYIANYAHHQRDRTGAWGSSFVTPDDLVLLFANTIPRLRHSVPQKPGQSRPKIRHRNCESQD